MKLQELSLFVFPISLYPFSFPISTYVLHFNPNMDVKVQPDALTRFL
jgi:hypothetical protein